VSDEKNLILHKNGLGAGSLIDQSLGRLTQEEAKQLMAKAADAALDLEIKKCQQDYDYERGRRAAEDHIDTFDSLNKAGRFTTHRVSSDIKTGAGRMNIESKSGGACFVASVAYADPNHPDVVFLRAYRDGVLLNSTIGRSFVAWYRLNGPRLAKVVEKSKTLKVVSRYLIAKVVLVLKYAGYSTADNRNSSHVHEAARRSGRGERMHWQSDAEQHWPDQDHRVRRLDRVEADGCRD
jgi:hypothetical protein